MSKEKSDEKGKNGGSHLGHQLFVVALVAILGISILGVVLMNLSDDGNDDDHFVNTTGAIGDASMDEETQQKWNSYLEYAPTIELDMPDVEARWVDGGDLEFIDDLPDPEENTGWSGGYRDYDGTDEAVPIADKNSDDDALSEDGGADAQNREVEESDIIKVVEDRLFLLNSYRGFVVVNLEDPNSPVVESRLPIIGNPVSMYVVDFLAFVIVSGTPKEGNQYGDWNSGTLFIVDITDTASPRVVQMVDINGYPVDSRRVGEVLYIVSYREDYGYYLDEEMVMIDDEMGEDDVEVIEDTEPSSKGSSSDGATPEEETLEGTEVVSIGFSDPENVGEVDREVFSERSENIHVTSRAIFVSGNNYDYNGGRWPDYSTTLKYVDISDPEGDIKIRDSIEVEGQLQDRYQMDFHEGMLRVVTQIPQDPLWVSKLHVINCRNTGDLKIEGDLLIDDAGSLMATRFAGDRAYTIHLPYSVDPLDVLDLSDPSDPKLCDVLEIPGWVEHMEVRGYQIIAIGVDDTDGNRNVAVSLFDVTDPYNAKMTSRVTVGDGYTYSQANWDDKALTILDDENLILFPFSSYTWEGWDSSTYGVQLVSFDLEKGTLEVRGTIEGSYPVERTRLVDGTIITTSDKAIQTIDPTDPDKPRILASLDLVSNIVDISEVDGHLITSKLPLWGSSGARITISSLESPDTTVGEFGPSGLVQESIEVEGSMILIRGIRPSEDGNATLEIYAYDVSNPLSVVAHDPYVEELPGYSGSSYYYYSAPRWITLDDGGVLLFQESYDYYPYYYEDDSVKGGGSDMEETRQESRMSLISWEVAGEPEVIDIPWNMSLYPGDAYGSSEELIIISHAYWYYYGSSGSIITSVDVVDGVADIGEDMTVTGNIVMISANLTIAYTSYSWWNETQMNSLNGYDISGEHPSLIFSIALNTPVQNVYLEGESMILTSGGGYYPYYGYDMAYTEGVRSPGQMEKPKTVITVFDLIEGIPESRVFAEVDGYYYGTTHDEGVLLLQNGYSLVGVDTQDREDLKILGTWMVPGQVQDSLVQDDRILISMGMHGIQSLDIA